MSSSPSISLRHSLLGATLLLCAACATGELEPQPNNQNDTPITIPTTPATTPSGPNARTVENGYVNEGCDLLEQDCADGPSGRRKCVLDEAGAGICVTAGEARARNAACEQVNECGAALICISWGDARGARCEQVCDPKLPEACGQGEVCSGGISSSDTYRLCLPVPTSCDLIAQDCTGNLTCVLMHHPTSGELSPLCGKSGPNDEGQSCGSGLGGCQRGMICAASAGGAAPACVRVCALPGGEQCDADQSCDGFTTTGQSFCE